MHTEKKIGPYSRRAFLYTMHMHIIHIYYPVELLGRSIYRYMRAYNTHICKSIFGLYAHTYNIIYMHI